MDGRKVFVSGGAGVIGLEMVPLLLERGAIVLVGDLKPRPEAFPPEVRYRQGDLNSITQGELENFAPDIFIHLAATFERSTETYGFWDDNFWNNVRLSHHLMAILKDSASLKRVVFASSYLIYDPARYQFAIPQATPVSLNEAAPVRPRNLTGMAKLAHEIELQFLDGFRSPSFTAVCARIFRGYGRNSRDVISRWVQALLADEPITVYRPEGLFDYIYAKDSAEGLVRLAENHAVSGIFNLGTGRARRVRDVVDILRRHFPSMKVVEEVSDIPYEASQADMSAYRAAMGWKPEFDLERAIPEIIAHERTKRSKENPKHGFGHVLVTSASKKVSLVREARRAAAKIGPDIQVIAGDTDENALARYVADGFWKMPRTVDSEIDGLIAGCRERGIGAIIPTRDGELAFWARYRSLFAEYGIDVIVSPIDGVRVCFDKLAFARFGRVHGLPFIPAGVNPDEVGDGPYVVKERYGAGSRKIGMRLGREAAIEHGKLLEDPIYQPFVAGREISADAWLDRSGRVKGLVLRNRDRVVDGESQVTTTFRDARTEEMVMEVLGALELRGPVVVQAIIDDNDRLNVIECNARFGGASTASIAAGLDVFYWSLLESRGVDVTEYPFDRAQGEIRQVRIPSDLHIHGRRF